MRSFKRALAIDPSDPYASGELGRVCMFAGAVDEARKTLANALRADPLNWVIHLSALEVDFLSGDFGTFQREGSRLLGTSDFPVLRAIIAIAFIHDQRPQDALRVLRGLAEQVPTFSGQSCRFLRLALEGQRDAAMSCFDADLLDRARNVDIWSLWVSECHAFVDETDLAIEWLETAFRKGFWHFPYVSTHSSIFRRLHGHPRFEKVLAEMKSAWERFEP